MKIAYVNYIKDIDSLRGVYNKIQDQAFSLFKNNCPINTFIITYSNPPKDSCYIKFIQIPKDYGYVSRALFLTKNLVSYFSDYSVVILRSVVYSPLVWFYFRKRKFKLVCEIHTKLFPELKLIGKPINYVIQRLSYRLCQAVIDAKISMTDEIADYEKKIGFKKPIQTISNGIKVPNVPIGFMPFDGRVLNMIFIGSHFQLWHGIDRLLRGMEKYQGSIQFNLHIVGDISESIMSNYLLSNHNVIFYGVQTKLAIDKLYKQVTLAVSTLACFRKNLLDACVLKTRDYSSRGVPFIYAYNDIDIDGEKSFCLKFPNDDTYINMNEVIEFAKLVSINPNQITQQLHLYAKQYMSWDIKMKQYAQFVEQV